MMEDREQNVVERFIECLESNFTSWIFSVGSTLKWLCCLALVINFLVRESEFVAEPHHADAHFHLTNYF